MSFRVLDYRMFIENGTFKRAEVIESILNSFIKSEEDEICLKQVPGLNYEAYDYYLESVQTLARSRQEYLVNQSDDNVFGLFLRSTDKLTKKVGLVYISDTNTEEVLECRFNEVRLVGNKLFQGLDDRGNCLGQCYDTGYSFVDITGAYLHEILELAGFKFYLLNRSETDLHNSEFLYVEVMELNEDTGEFTDVTEDEFILRDEEEYFTFLEELMNEIRDLYTEDEYEELIRISNEICAELKS